MYEHGTDKVIARRDLLHPNADGHKSMSDTIILYLAQQVCLLFVISLCGPFFLAPRPRSWRRND